MGGFYPLIGIITIIIVFITIEIFCVVGCLQIHAAMGNGGRALTEMLVYVDTQHFAAHSSFLLNQGHPWVIGNE